jgi:hypothetical protein
MSSESEDGEDNDEIGCPLEAHIKLIREDSGSCILTHVLTREVHKYNAEPGVEFDLVTGEDGVMLCSSDGSVRDKVADVMRQELTLDENSWVQVQDNDSGLTKKIKPDEMFANCLYIPLVNVADVSRLKLYRIQWSVPHVWWELRRFAVFFDISVSAFPKYITQHWRNWTSWMTRYGLTVMFLRGSFDKRDYVEQHYLRFADHPVASTVGLLIILSTRYLTGRPASARSKVIHSLFLVMASNHLQVVIYQFYVLTSQIIPSTGLQPIDEVLWS